MLELKAVKRRSLEVFEQLILDSQSIRLQESK